MRTLLPVALSLSVIACGHWPQQEPQPFVPGLYTFSLTPEEIPPEVPPDILPFMVGTYVVTFWPDGRLRNEVNGKLDAEGHYASTPQYLVITDEDGPGHCQSERATGVYSWSLQGDQLRVKSLEDKCRWREFAITRKPWIHIPSK